jgi:hypothetical protein
VPLLPSEQPSSDHRESEVLLPDFQVSKFLTQDLDTKVSELVSLNLDPYDTVNPLQSIPLAVHKLLERWEMKGNPGVTKALATEKSGLLAEGTWDESNPVEFDKLVADAKSAGETLHLGELMTIASIKHWETPALHKYKVRIVHRGDNVKDQDGQMAVFQELSASPSAIHTINSNMAYGCLAGHKTTMADAEQAYLQADLNSKHPNWVRIPKELWPEDWHRKGFIKPMCRLVKALYGHPESGGHWEQHLTKAVVGMGGIPVQEHPSSFRFPKLGLLLSVYVDDLLLSGPEGNHEDFWRELRKTIRLGEPEPLDRFLGRNHKFF